jgi:hypothetical protein
MMSDRDLVFARMLRGHYDCIMSPGLPNEAMAEGLHALDLCNRPGYSLEGRALLEQWYKKWATRKSEA